MSVRINVRPSNAYYRGTKSLDGNKYIMTFRWNTTTEKWYMDMRGLNNSVDIKGDALLCGKEILGKHGYYQLGQLWVVDNSGADEDPNFSEFGSRWTLEYTPVS
jgi:hypothetical protein